MFIRHFLKIPFPNFAPEDEAGEGKEEPKTPSGGNEDAQEVSEETLATSSESEEGEGEREEPELAFLSALDDFEDEDEEPVKLEQPAEAPQQVQPPKEESATTTTKPDEVEAKAPDAAAKDQAPAGAETPKAPADEVKAPTTVDAATAAPTTEPEQPEVPTADQISETWNKWRGETLGALTQHYQPSDDDMDKIAMGGEEARQVLGRYKAEIYLDAVQASIGHIVNNLPNLIGALQQQQQQISQREEKFFQRWPQLQEHRDSVLRIGSAFQKANKTYTEEQFIEEVGAATAIALRLPIEHSTNGTGNGTGEAKERPFSPAMPATPQPAKMPNSNPFEAADRELFEEDLDS